MMGFSLWAFMAILGKANSLLTILDIVCFSILLIRFWNLPPLGFSTSWIDSPINRANFDRHSGLGVHELFGNVFCSPSRQPSCYAFCLRTTLCHFVAVLRSDNGYTHTNRSLLLPPNEADRKNKTIATLAKQRQDYLHRTKVLYFVLYPQQS